MGDGHLPVGYGPKRAVQTGAAVRTAGDGHMNNDLTNRPPRILIADDNAAIHSVFRKTLGGLSARGRQLDDLEKSLFGGAAAPRARESFRLDSGFQGREALAMVHRALEEYEPCDPPLTVTRMPP